jgi:probable HAF family extracellular repeat protein
MNAAGCARVGRPPHAPPCDRAAERQAPGQLQPANEWNAPSGSARAGSSFTLTNATGINDSGQIVAQGSNNTTGQNHAFLLTPS